MWGMITTNFTEIKIREYFEHLYAKNQITWMK